MNKTKFKQTETCGERSPEQGEGRSRTIGEIPEGWDKVLLKDVAVVNEKTIDKEYPHSKIEYVDIASVNKGRIFEIKKLLRSEAPSRAQRIVRDNDILLSTVRPNLKHFAFMKGANPNTIASTGFAVISSKTINPRFLYYYLTTDRYTDHLSAIADAHTSTYPAFNPDILENSEIPFPSENEQRAIAKILSDLDDKIELNHQMNKTLESIAQAIFKRWFVDFESTGSFDWQVDELGKHIQFIKGKKPSQISETQLAGHRPQILIDNLNGNPSLYANENGMIVVGIDEPIMVMDGASSGRVEIGHNGVLGSTLAKVIVTSDRISNLFLYYYLKDKEPDINQNTTGTSIPHTDKEKIKRYQCNLPPKDLLENFNEIAGRIVNKVITNKRETGFLIQIRDSLLPRLMSGKIRVGIL